MAGDSSIPRCVGRGTIIARRGWNYRDYRDHCDGCDDAAQSRQRGATAQRHLSGGGHTQAIDIHAGAGWLIRDNQVQNMVTSTGALPVAGAVVAWNGSFDTVVDRNVLLNCAFGIGLGTNFAAGPPPSGRDPTFHHVGGIIRNNAIAGASVVDFGIAVGCANGVEVYHNTSWRSGYSGAIEVFPLSGGTVHVKNNLISSNSVRDRTNGDGTIDQQQNVTASSAWFVDASNADLHLSSQVTGAIDQATPLSGSPVILDIDGESRPGGTLNDVGADER